MIRIWLPRKPAEIIMTAVLVFASMYYAFLGKTITETERVLLILSALLLGYFLLEVIKDRIILYGWSLASVIWGIPAFFVIWIFIREIIFAQK